MTPEEKAKSLYESYKETLNIQNDMRPGANPFAIQCAIICVEQIIESMGSVRAYFTDTIDPMKYWQEVIAHLQNS